MSGVAGLVDTLLAEKLSQRADLVALKSAAVVTGPGPAGRVPAVANDVRLQSDASMQRALSEPEPAAPASVPAASAGAQAVLSAAGRALSSLLAASAASSERVQGSAPLVAGDQKTQAPAIAQALAEAVGLSGLFYESHLAEMSQGLLAPADLQREPQWAASARAHANLGTTAAATAPAGAPAAAAAAPAQAAATAHAATILPQQLELLASGVFRWSGEAWPGTPMEWLIQQERENDAACLPHTGGRRWGTTFGMYVKGLGAIEVRLTLAASAPAWDLQARVRAEAPALQALEHGAAELHRRLQRAGFQADIGFMPAQREPAQ
jgi:hypothetical protein